MLHYFRGKYDSNHWAMAVNDTLFDIGMIVSASCLKFRIKLNPTDSRCYRLLVIYDGKYRKEDSIQEMLDTQIATWNRSYSLQEKIDLLNVIAHLSDVLEKALECVIQIEIAGNNCHQSVLLNDENGESGGRVFQVGNADEPSILHGHIILRGIVGYEYIPGVPYQGPQPGELFDMRHGKVAWRDNEAIFKVVSAFKEIMKSLLTTT